ncbi:uncharacterized protein LOC101239070 isoform X1 [Hydra vulgaris]|uniref:uncharacterized protein LOC101239070 isoform X1 n=1 Tax=Hydra vulgaris TaxID=6087 RepID=UPI001F5FE3E2|nr:uncharacterized protein LOC101239070 isoform X2 [Hydra vulgaris]
MLVLLLFLFEAVSNSETLSYRQALPKKFSFETLSTFVDLPNFFDVLGCRIESVEKNCVRIFKPKLKCPGFNLAKVFKLLSNQVDLDSLTNRNFPSGVFEVKRFEINSCNSRNKNVIFFCEVVESFHVINDKIQIVEGGKLEITFDLKRPFRFSHIGFKIDGKINIANKLTVEVQVNKVQGVSSSSLSLTANQINVIDFSEAFLENNNDLSREALFSQGGMFSNIFNVKIKIIRYEDRSYKLIADGEMKISGHSSINALLFIQKPNDNPIGVGIVAFLKNVNPLNIISLITKKQLNEINILKNLRLDITVEFATKNLANLRDSPLNKKSAVNTNKLDSLSKGTLISFSYPAKKFLNNIGSSINALKEILFQIKITSKKLNFAFPTNIFDDGMKILATLAPNAFRLLNRYLFKSNFKIIFNKYDVNIKTKQAEISISVPEKISLGDNILSVENTVIELKVNPQEFDFILVADLKLSDTLIKIKVVKLGNKFVLNGDIPMMTLHQLTNIFGTEEISKIVSKIPNFKFKFINLGLSAEFGENARALRLKGTAVFNDWKDMVFEAFIIAKQVPGYKHNLSKRFIPISRNQYINQSSLVIDSHIYDDSYEPKEEEEQENREENVEIPHEIDESSFESGSESNSKDLLSRNLNQKRAMMANKQMGLAFIIKDIKFDEIAALFFDGQSSFTNWISLDIVLTISNTESKEFTLKEVNEDLKTVERGIYLIGKMRLPNNCLDNELCDFVKQKLPPMSTLFVAAGYKDHFFFRAGYDGIINLTENLDLNSIYLGVSIQMGIIEISLNGKLTLRMKKNLLTFEVSVGIDITGGLRVSGKMIGMWSEPFSTPYIAVGNAEVSITIQLPFLIRSFELSGEVHLGKSGKKIVAKAGVGIDMTGRDNYFYGDINELSLGAFCKAFDYNLNLPKVILDSGFKELSIGYSFLEKKLANRFLKAGFHLEGTLNILGLIAKTKVEVETKKLLIDCEILPIGTSSSYFELTRSLTDNFNGPKIFINISPKSVKVFIKGAIRLLNISSAVTIDIDNNGLKFYVEGNLFNLFYVNLKVEASYGNKMNLDKAGFKVSACLSTDIANNANKITNNGLEDAVKKVNGVVSYAEKKLKKYSAQHNEFVSKKESLSNIRNKLFDKMTVTFAKIEEYQSKVGSSCTDQCHRETGYFAKNWCSANCLLDKGEASIRIEGKKNKQNVRSMVYESFDEVFGFFDWIKEQGEKLLNTAKEGFITVGNKIVDVANDAYEGVKAGFEIVKDAAVSFSKKIIDIHLVCFNTSLEIASKACFGVKVNVTIVGSQKLIDIDICFQTGFISAIAKKISDFFYPGIEALEENIEIIKSKFSFFRKKVKELSKKKLLVEKKSKKLEEQVNRDNVDSDEMDDISDGITRKNNLYKNITLDEIKCQIYNENHIVSLTDGDVLDALDIYPDYTNEINFSKNESVDVSDLAQQIIGEKNKCELAQGLVRNYEKISNQFNEMLSFLENQKQLHKKQCLDFHHKFNSLERVAIEKCKQAKCNKIQRQKLVFLAHSLTHAHVTRAKKLDEDFEAIGKRFIESEKEAMARNIDSSGMTVETFLSKLKYSTETASLIPSKTNEYRSRLNASFTAVQNLFVNDDLPYKSVALSFQSMKSNLAFLRENIPCAA